MKNAEWLLARFPTWADRIALVVGDAQWSYEDLRTSIEEWKQRFRELGCGPGAVIAFQGDYGAASISILLACVDLNYVVVPLAPGTKGVVQDFLKISEARVLVCIEPGDHWSIGRLDGVATNPLTLRLIDAGEPGLVIFSSGSTGAPKASLHSVTRFLSKFERERSAMRTIAVPPMDHVAGLDTLFYCLSSGGTLVCPESRDPDVVCEAIGHNRVELLPASATFLNLIFASHAHERHDLSSLRVIAFGSDVMPEATLNRLSELLPETTLLQKYGTTEFGSPTTKSRDDGSLWIKIDDKRFETKVVDGMLWVRSQSAMMGYLNAPSPFAEDGWINTGDMVEESAGGYLRILGRNSDVINVGGHKVFPAEVETVLLQLSNVEDAVVYGMANPIMGKVVAARLRLTAPEDISSLKRRVREFCRERLISYKIPVAIDAADCDLMTARQKKMRRVEALVGPWLS
jgi:long-chain acyl-CoA synthetase